MLKKLTVVAALLLATACAAKQTATVVTTPAEGDVIYVTEATPPMDVTTNETTMHFETTIVPVEESAVNAPMMSSAQETTATEPRMRMKKD
jgi:hypothetical protein